MPLAIDLFCGVGGLSLGIEAAGFNLAAAVEIDPIAAQTHHLNFPNCQIINKDICQVEGRKINRDAIARFGREIELVVGSPPCQGYSFMGLRNADDPRNLLIFEFARIVAEIRPKYFIFENVPGMLAGKHKQHLEALIEEFDRLGYSIATPVRVLDASLYGAAQKRKRLILIGSRSDVEPANYPEPTHGTGKLPLVTVKDAIADLAEIPVYIGQDLGIDPELLNFSLNHKTVYNINKHIDTLGLVFGHLGSIHSPEVCDRFAASMPGKVEPISRFLKLHPDGLCNTLRAGTNSDRGSHTSARPIHYLHPRCITVREAARLHSYPDWFQFNRTIWHGFRQIGNSVIPIFAKALGEEVFQKVVDNR